MLKIKDNVDLKELEKFGFEELPHKYWRDINKTYWTICIDKKTREIKCWNYGYGGTKKPDKYIEDLIQAGLVEKV